MTTVRIALRLVQGGGAKGVLRAVLMIIGMALGVITLVFVATVPGVLDRRGDVVGARQPDYAQAGATSTFQFEVVDGLWANVGITRVLLAETSPDAPVPPGLTAFPAPGQVFVSPAAMSLARSDPAFASLLGGGTSGVINPAGLTGPDEIYAYVGVDRDTLSGGSPGNGWGGDPDPTTIAQYQGVPTELAVLILIPTVIYLVVCSNLSAATRTRRYAALRLLGMSRKSVLRVAALEAGALGLIGGIVGLLGYHALNGELGPSGIAGFEWYPTASQLSYGGALLALILVVAVAAAVGALGTGRSLSRPLAARFDQSERKPQWWLALPLMFGLGLLLVLLLFGRGRSAAQTGYARAGELTSAELAVGVVLVTVGILLVLRPIMHLIGRFIATRNGPVAIRLAARRLQLEPAGTVWLMTGLILLIQVAAVGAAVLHLVQLSALPPGTTAQVSVAASDIRSDDRQAVYAAGAEPRWVLDASVITTPPPQSYRPSTTDISDYVKYLGVQMIVAPCDVAAGIVGNPLAGCTNGASYRLNDPPDSGIPALPVGFPITFDTQDGHTITYQAPEGEILLGSSSTLTGPLILITDPMPPYGFSERSIMYFALPSGIVRLDDFLSRVASIAPGATPEVMGLDLDLLAKYRVQHGAIEFGVSVGFLLGITAFVIAVIDRSMERRRQVAALAVLGARHRTLRAVQLTYVLISMTLSVVVAIAAGHIAGNAILRLDNLQVGWFYGTVYAALPLVVFAFLGAVAAGLFTPGARPRAEDLRRE